MTPNCPDWVDAAPFRHHVRDLICQSGLSWRLIAAHAGVAPRAIHSLLHGRRGTSLRLLHVTVARALAEISVESIAADEHVATDIAASRQLLAALGAAGHESFVRAQLRPEDLACLEDIDAWQCSRALAARVSACYDLATTTRRDRGRVVSAAPSGAPVDCVPHPQLDRKAPAAWTRGSSSTPSRGNSGC